MDPVLALSIGGQIEKYGAYAGFAAIPGLAVLALLYFAQARELKRLREWAGRSPERAAELQNRVAPATQPPTNRVTQGERRVVAQPKSAPGAAATPAGAGRAGQATQPPRVPAGAPAGAAPNSAPLPGAPAKPAAAPAAAPVTAATAAAPAASPAATPPADGEAEQDTVARPPLTPPAERAPGTADGTQRAAAALGAPRATTAAPAKPAAAASATAAAGAQAPPRRRPPVQAPPPRDRGRNGDAGDGPPSRLPLIAGGAVGLLIAIVALFMLLGGGGDDTTSEPNAPGGSTGAAQTTPGGTTAAGKPLNRADTTVAVLNGTTVPGAAASVADELEQAGFKRGQVTNAADQQAPETTVAFAQGAKPAADEVAKLIKVAKVTALDANTQTIAGPDATVVVTVGTDRTQ